MLVPLGEEGGWRRGLRSEEVGVASVRSEVAQKQRTARAQARPKRDPAELLPQSGAARTG